MLTTENILKDKLSSVYFRYLLPAIFTAISGSLFCFVDLMFIGMKMSSTGLSAVNIAAPIFSIYASISALIGIGGASTVAVEKGKGNLNLCNQIFSTCMYLAIGLGVLLSAIGLIFLDPIATMFGATPELLPYVRIYQSIITLAGLIYVPGWTLTHFIRNDGNPKLSMMASVITNVVNIVLDAVLVLWLDLELWGAAFATLFSNVAAFFVLMLHFWMKRNNITFVSIKLSILQLIRWLKNGLGSFWLEISFGIVLIIFNRVLMDMGGETAVSTYAIISNIGFIIYAVINGVCQSAQPIIGVNFGAGQMHRVRKTLVMSIVISFAFGAVLFAACLFFANPIASLFAGGEVELIDMSAKALIPYCAFALLVGFNMTNMYFFQSMQKSLPATIIAVSRSFVFNLTGLFLLAPILGLDGIWLSHPFSESVTVLISLAFMIFFLVRTKEKAPKA